METTVVFVEVKGVLIWRNTMPPGNLTEQYEVAHRLTSRPLIRQVVGTILAPSKV